MAVKDQLDSVRYESHDRSFSHVQENMTRMLMVTDVQDSIKRHQAQIISSLKDPDIRYQPLTPDRLSISRRLGVVSVLLNILNETSVLLTCRRQFLPFQISSLNVCLWGEICSIRRRSLDLLYGMCDVSNAKDIVEELLQVWPQSGFSSF